MGEFPYDRGETFEDPVQQRWADDATRVLKTIKIAGDDIGWYAGNGSPETVVTANVGSLYSRLDGGAGTTLYVKESGTGNTGWAAV